MAKLSHNTQLWPPYGGSAIYQQVRKTRPPTRLDRLRRRPPLTMASFFTLFFTEREELRSVILQEKSDL